MPTDKVRIYGDITKSHENEFLFIKGVYGCKSNGDAIEKMIEMISPGARAKAAASKGVIKKA